MCLFRCSILYTTLWVSTCQLRCEEPVEKPSTYCNPLSLPNYPVGRFARDLNNGDHGPAWMWRLGRRQQFRELALLIDARGNEGNFVEADLAETKVNVLMRSCDRP